MTVQIPSLQVHLDQYEQQLDRYYNQEKTLLKNIRHSLNGGRGEANGRAQLLRSLQTALPETPRAVGGAKKGRMPRSGTMAARIIGLMQRNIGASLSEMTAASKWKGNSVRGFISGVVVRQMGHRVETNTGASGEQRYFIKKQGPRQG